MMQAWSEYWESGSLDCLPSGNENIIDEYWLNYFDQLKPQTYQFIDVACGNGYLTNQIIAKVPNLIADNVIAYDQADVILKNARIELLNSFDTLVNRIENQSNNKQVLLSNFGIEYLPIEQSHQLLETIAKLNGHIMLVTHACESELHINSKKILSAVKVWQEDQELRNIEMQLHLKLSADLAKSYIFRISQLEQQYKGLLSLASITNAVLDVFSGISGQTNLEERFTTLHNQYFAYVERIKSQLIATENVDNLAKVIRDVAGQNGLAFKSEKVTDKHGNLVANAFYLNEIYPKG